MVAVFKIISAIFMAITTLISFPVAGNISADFAPKDEENVKLTFATMSDTHMKDSATRAFMLELGLSDMENSDYRLDALVHAGDVTKNVSRKNGTAGTHKRNFHCIASFHLKNIYS